MLLVRLVSVPQKEVDLAADTLQEGIEKAAVILDELKDLALGIDREIARLLGMPNVPQTPPDGLRHHCQRLGLPRARRREVRRDKAPQPRLRPRSRQSPGRDPGRVGRSPQDQLLAHLRHRPGHPRPTRLTPTTSPGASSSGSSPTANTSLPSTPAPESAALLARLAVAKLQTPGNEVDWADPEAIGSLRIGDFACGTGALLSAVYEQVAARCAAEGSGPPGVPAQARRT